MPGVVDCVGKRYGKLVGVEFIGWNNHNQRIWRWRCDCGNVVEKVFSNVNCGDTRSCGCTKSAKGRKAHNKLDHGEASFNCYYAAYKARAKSRGFGILPKHRFRVLTSQNCYYCGVAPLQEFNPSKNVNGSYLCNGLDRVDNRLGYEESNLVPCCYICNRAKGSVSKDEFEKWLKRVAAFQSETSSTQ